MKEKWVEKLFAVLLCGLAAFMCPSCEKKSAEETVQSVAGSIKITVQETSPRNYKDMARYSSEDGIICVLFGYGFNSEGFLNDFLVILKDRYGLESNGGIIFPVVFTEDDMEDILTISKISSIYDIINERNIKGIILLGAPEGTHRYLGKLRQDWDERPPYAIFSFMPQDDIMGEEFNCDFVLEYERNASPEEEEVEVKAIDKTAEQIVLRAVRYMEDLPNDIYSPDSALLAANAEPSFRNSVFSDKDLHSHVQSIVGEKKVRRYVDGETGIQSINHFVIEQDK
ncbi:MAG: hypothetical protein ILP18_04865 [Treponema sp.]|nr:hypothetical protein [Treponema sp.]